ncbi:MAG: hypothetical protein R3E95_14420 [Thiolinea sp.]
MVRVQFGIDHIRIIKLGEREDVAISQHDGFGPLQACIDFVMRGGLIDLLQGFQISLTLVAILDVGRVFIEIG